MNLLKNCKLTLVKAATASGTSQVDASLDMNGYDGVVFIGSVATQAAGNFAKCAHSADNSTFADLAGTKRITSTNGNAFALEIAVPLKRYLRVSVVRGTATAVGDIYAIQYKGRKAPAIQDATIDALTVVSPSEGTP